MAYRILFRPTENNSVSIPRLSEAEEQQGYFKQFYMTAKSFETYEDALEFLEQIPFSSLKPGIIKDAIATYLKQHMKVTDFQYCLDHF